MGCAAGKEEAAVAHGNNEHPAGAADGVHRAALMEHAHEVANRRPQTLSLFWVPGCVDNTNQPPHFVPNCGPMSVFEKLPPCAGNTRKKVLACTYQPQPIPPPQQSLLHEATTATASASSAAVQHPSSDSLNVTTTSSLDVSAATPTKPSNALPSLHLGALSAGNRKYGRPLSAISKSIMLPVMNINQPPAFPIPRWFSVDPQLPSSERVLLEAAEGKLSVHGGGGGTSSAASHGGGNNNSGVLAAGKPPPGIGSGGVDAAAIVAGATQSDGHHTVTFRSHFVLPDDAVVCRAFFPQCLHNFSVGWVKVPAGPVSRKTTHTSPPAAAAEQHQQPFVIRNDIEGLEAPENGGVLLNGDHTTLGAGDTTSPFSSPAIKDNNNPQRILVGYLNAEKPVYDVSKDGPVASPYETIWDAPDMRNDGQQHPPVAPPLTMVRDLVPRYLEKYFLYPKTITAICITLAWKNACDVDAAFTDVTPQHSVALTTACLPFQLKTAETSGSAGMGGYRHIRPTQHTAISSSSTHSGGTTGAYFFAMPCKREDITSEVPSSSMMQPVGMASCLPSLSQSLMMSETTFPMYPIVPTAAQYPQLVKAISESTTDASSSSLENAVREAAVLSHDDICWLAFRLRFLEWLCHAAQCVAAATRTAPRCNPLPSPSSAEAVHLAIRLGVKFQFDNQNFIAFNDHGHNNQVEGRPPPGGSLRPQRRTLFDDEAPSPSGPSDVNASGEMEDRAQSYLQFIDRTRSSYDISAVVAESSPLVLSCRLHPLAAAAVPPPSLGGGPVYGVMSFTQAAELELKQLRMLFSHCLSGATSLN